LWLVPLAQKGAVTLRTAQSRVDLLKAEICTDSRDGESYANAPARLFPLIPAENLDLSHIIAA
jgi:hypothetical protein